MNRFDAELNAARKRHRLLYLSTFFGLTLTGLGVALMLLWSNGTAVKVMPADAAINAQIEVTDGAALTLEGVIFGFSSAPEVRVRAIGFRELQRRITPDERGGTITVTLQELPGTLIATTRPADDLTRWSLNGTALGIGVEATAERPPGSYQLRADNPYFMPIEQTVELKRGAEENLTLALAPVQGSLNIDSRPEGAEVKVNDTVHGITPLKLEVNGGPYAVVVSAPDYNPISDTITLTNVKPDAARTYRLTPVTGTLRFNVTPSGGTLLVGGRKVDPGAALQIAANTAHQISYLKDGYAGALRNVTLSAGENQLVTIKLQPNIGKVEVYTDPAAEVFINGKSRGMAPLNLELIATPHTIELRKPGYRSVRKTITPSSESTTRIRETLQTEQAATLAAAPATYEHSTGIRLKLFKPNETFVMGAPRHEKGQRANEFERTVSLAKPFYAALHEVTSAQYQRFDASHPGIAREPVRDVTWLKAAAFCNWLSKSENLTPIYKIDAGKLISVNANANGYRLLTEAEWEWLARKAGRTATTTFPWGDDATVPKNTGNIADERAKGLTDFFVPNYNDGYAVLAPVGSFAKEASGLFDITGNVSEWMHDAYVLSPPKPGELFVNPTGSGVSLTHVVKGSSWRSGTRTTLRAAYREGAVMTAYADDIGFRVGRYVYGQ